MDDFPSFTKLSQAFNTPLNNSFCQLFFQWLQCNYLLNPSDSTFLNTLQTM